MNITIEDNKVVVNLDEVEFPQFQAMFANLQRMKSILCEFRNFNVIAPSTTTCINILPMHLCRTIGEANLYADPFATLSLYPFWKHGFAFETGTQLRFNLKIDDMHKKGVAADEFGMGFCAWAMEEIFNCVEWADTTALLRTGAVAKRGLKWPDFVCTFPDGSLGVFEAKGTTFTEGELTPALAEGKIQTSGITATDPITMRVVVGTAMASGSYTARPAKVILVDPPEKNSGSVETNLTAELVANAARHMRSPVGAHGRAPETGEHPSVIPAEAGIHGEAGEPPEEKILFRGPEKDIILKRQEYKEDKKHGWLAVG